MRIERDQKHWIFPSTEVIFNELASVTPIYAGMSHERLVGEGTMANLATLHPVLSPMLWTSIATGKRPFKHGVLGFTEPTEDASGIRPVTSLSRKVKALWNILGQEGLRSNVVGWWPSHPAEPIRGAMVSNHYHRAVGPIDQPWPMAPGTVHPGELADTAAMERAIEALIGARAETLRPLRALGRASIASKYTDLRGWRVAPRAGPNDDPRPGSAAQEEE